jgi:hypothetical protein
MKIEKLHAQSIEQANRKAKQTFSKIEGLSFINNNPYTLKIAKLFDAKSLVSLRSF